MTAPNRPRPPKLDGATVKTALADPSVTPAELNAALAGVDQDGLYDVERNAWTTQVWDRASPINDVPAQHFLNRDDVDENGDDDIYLLLHNGVVVGFQPHEPGLTGYIRVPKGNGAERGDAHADGIAAGRTAAEVVKRVAAAIKESRRPK